MVTLMKYWIALAVGSLIEPLQSMRRKRANRIEHERWFSEMDYLS